MIEDPRGDDDLLRAPDPDVFGAFYARHARAVEAFFARRTGDRVLASCDLAGETFAAALIARRRFRAGGPPARAWLYTIAARRLADHRRRAAAEDRLQQRLMAHRRLEVAEDPAPWDQEVARCWRCSSACRMSSARLSPRTSSRGLDCSSYVSLTLRRAGLLASERALSSREIAVDWGVAGEGDHMTVWAGAGHAWLEFALAGEQAERLQVGPDATESAMPVAARERRAREFVPRRGRGSEPRSVRAADDFDPEAVGIEQIRGVVARAVLVARARRAVVGAAGRQRACVGGVDRGPAAGGDGDVAEARRRGPPAGDDPQPRVVDAVADGVGRVEDPPPAERVEERVVERGGAREVGDLEADVVEHGERFSRARRTPLVSAERAGAAGT